MDLQEHSESVGSKWDQQPLGDVPRKEKRKTMKKLKRKVIRKEAAERERAEEAAFLNDPAEQLRIELQDQAEAEALQKARNDFEHHERIWLLNYQKAQRKRQEELHRKLAREAAEKEEEENWEYVEDGPAEIIWQGNEIIVQKKRIRVPRGKPDVNVVAEDSNRPISNPLVPQHDAFEAYKKPDTSGTGLVVFDVVEQQIPNFGTEQDMAHCPFHIKTGACRFGARCSRAHFYPDKSCTLLMKNMYNGPGLTWEQEEGLEYTDEEVTQHYEEFYDDVHTEFLKFGELVNFKVCKNGSSHLRGNVYVHYVSLDSAIDAYNAINGRFFAAKQVICEFVTVTRWRGAICGEYMKSRHKSCSHGSACNFLHCFENPGGEYEWADWDGRPPRSWQRKMDMLFGGSRVDQHRKQRVQDHWHCFGHFDREIQSRSGCRNPSRRHKSHERDFCSSDEGGGTPIREYSGGSKYSSEGEREQWPDFYQPCDTYNRRVNRRRCSHNRSGIEKSNKGDEVISEEDRKNMDRHQLRRKKRKREHTYGHDNDDEERSAIGVDMHLAAGEMQLKRTPIRECSGSRKYSSEEEREQRSDFDQSCDTYNRRVNQRSCSNLDGGIEKSKKGDEAISEEDKKNMDRQQIRRNKRHREHTCEHDNDNDNEERSVVGVYMHLTGEMQFKRRESCIPFESDDNMDKFKSNDREIMEEEDVKSSHYKKERKRRAQHQLDSVNIDQEKRKSSRSYHHGQSPCKHKGYRKILKRNRYSKSPRRSRNHNWSQSGDKGQGMSPYGGQYNNSLANKSRDSSSKAPERSDEGSFGSLDRWQASDDTKL